VTVALNTDEFVAAYKGAWPICSYEERLQVLSACRYVSLVVPQDVPNLGPQLEQIRPRYLVIGSDWARKDYYAQIGVSQEWLDAHSITLCYVPYTEGVSTTELKKRLNHGCSHGPCRA
jgi:glycerol-3-phosphate cytidylyltransferase